MIFGFETGFVYQNEPNHHVQPVEEYFVRTAVFAAVSFRFGTVGIKPYADAGLYSGYKLYDKEKTKSPAAQLGFKLGYATPTWKSIGLFVRGDYHYRVHAKEHWFEGDVGVYGLFFEVYVGRWAVCTPNVTVKVDGWNYSFTVPEAWFYGSKIGFALKFKRIRLFYEYLESDGAVKEYQHIWFKAKKWQPSMIRGGISWTF